MGEINRKILEEEFDLEEVDEIPIEEFKDVLKKAKDIENPTNVLTAIIDKAGTFLDLIEKESVNGAMSARYMEVAAAMINTIMAATTNMAQIDSTRFNDELKGYQTAQNDRKLDQKDRELSIKEAYYTGKSKGGGTTTNNNIIVADRETMLRLLQDKKAGKTQELISNE